MPHKVSKQKDHIGTAPMSSADLALSYHMLCLCVVLWALVAFCVCWRYGVRTAITGLPWRKETAIFYVDGATMLVIILLHLLITKSLNQRLLQACLIETHRLSVLSPETSDWLSLPSIKMVRAEQRLLRRSHRVSTESLVGFIDMVICLYPPKH